MTQNKEPTKKNFPAVSALILAAALAAASLCLAGCKDPDAGTESPLIYTGWAYGRLDNWKDYTDWGTWRTEVEATKTTVGRGFRTGTEHKVNIRQDNTVEKLDGAGNTRTYYGSGAAHLREEKVITANHDLNADGTLTVRENTVETLSLPDTKGIANFGKNVNVLSSIIHCNEGTDNIHDLLDYGEARLVAEEVLQGMTDQSRALVVFFDSATGNAKFTQLKNAESTIVAQSGVTTLNDFYNNLTAQSSSIINTIFTDPAEFNQYLDVYKQWNYLESRDWQTEGTPDAAVALAVEKAESFGTAVRALDGIEVSDNKGTTSFGSSYEIPANALTFDHQFRTVMKAQIKTALGLNGLTGAQSQRADAMADALITQLGQDSAELRAFMDGVSAEGLHHSKTGLGILETPVREGSITQAPKQSNTRLAHTGAKFSPDLIKTGADGREYTGNFIPYRKG